MEERLREPREVGIDPETSNRPMQEKNYKEPRMSILKNWEVKIRVLDVGCMINIGCKSFAFSNLEEALSELNLYFKDPETSRIKWEKKIEELNKLNN